MSELSGWENFYVIVGSSAGALIGLQFVVITLIADLPVEPGFIRAVDAFTTPTIVHFSAVLLLAAIVSAPWPAVLLAAVSWGVLGVGGATYTSIVAARMRTVSYKPQLEDWMFHAVVPLGAYLTLAVSAFEAREHEREALFAIGAAALLLLFAGIHNAWDAVTYNVFVQRRKQQEKNKEQR
jgi:hypothetical protein